MYITREAYERNPLLIKQGALLLWGTPLAKWIANGYVHQVYRLNDFYAEMCSDAKTSRLSYIVTFASQPRLAEVTQRWQGLP